MFPVTKKAFKYLYCIRMHLTVRDNVYQGSFKVNQATINGSKLTTMKNNPLPSIKTNKEEHKKLLHEAHPQFAPVGNMYFL